MPNFYLQKLKHFYVNKYLISPFSARKYYVSYSFKHKVLWFRVYKVATRTINQRLGDAADGQYIYSSDVGYNPAMYDDYFKFAFVRNPVERFLSGWKDKVVNQNYYDFSKEQHEQMMDIDVFIDWVKDLDLEKSDEHLRAQYALIDLNHINFLGRFERFEEDFKIVAERIGLGDYPMEKLNASGSKSVSYGIETERKIIQLYEKDVRLFYPELLDK